MSIGEKCAQRPTGSRLISCLVATGMHGAAQRVVGKTGIDLEPADEPVQLRREPADDVRGATLPIYKLIRYLRERRHGRAVRLR